MATAWKLPTGRHPLVAEMLLGCNVTTGTSPTHKRSVAIVVLEAKQLTTVARYR